MHRCFLLPLVLLLLPACAMIEGTTAAVDPKNLPSLTGQERALLISADASAKVGDLRAAERNYLSAIARSKGHIIAHLSLADLYMRQQRTDEAEAILEKAAALQPHHPELNWWRGRQALRANEAEAALEYFNEGLVKNASDLNLLTGAGIANDLLHRHDAAQVLYLRALSLNPSRDLTAARTNLAMSFLLTNEPKQAVKVLKPAVKQAGIPPVVRHNLALAYGLLGKHTQAKRLLNGELSEQERTDSIARLREHIEADKTGMHIPRSTPAVVRQSRAESPSLVSWPNPRAH